MEGLEVTTPEAEMGRMHARIYDLELWRARKDAVDDERHLQNTAAIKEVAKVSEANGKKLDTILLRTADKDGQAAGRSQTVKVIVAILTLLGGSGLVDLLFKH